MSDLLVEQKAEVIHEIYLSTARRLGWPIRPELDVPYSQLPEDAKELDRALARWHIAGVARAIRIAFNH